MGFLEEIDADYAAIEQARKTTIPPAPELTGTVEPSPDAMSFMDELNADYAALNQKPQQPPMAGLDMPETFAQRSPILSGIARTATGFGRGVMQALETVPRFQRAQMEVLSDAEKALGITKLKSDITGVDTEAVGEKVRDVFTGMPIRAMEKFSEKAFPRAQLAQTPQLAQRLQDVETKYADNPDLKAAEIRNVLRKEEWRQAPVQHFAEIIGEGAPLMIAALATRSPTLGASLFGLVQGTSTYEEAKAKDVGTAKAVIAGSLDAVGTALLERLPLKFIMKGSERGIRKMLASAGVEGTQEVAQQMWSNMVAAVGFDKSRQIMEGWFESFAGGAGLGGLAGKFAGVEKINYTGRTRTQEQITADAQAINELGPDAEGVELSNRQDEQTNIIETLAQLFGKRVVFVRNATWNGIHRAGNTLFVDESSGISGQPILGVFGHELSHSMETDADPQAHQLARQWDRTLRESVRSEVVSAYGQIVNAKRKARGKKELSLDDVWNEYRSDILGESLTRPDFWKRLANRDQKLLTKMYMYLADMVARLKGSLVTSDHYAVYQQLNEGELGKVLDASTETFEGWAKLHPKEAAIVAASFASLKGEQAAPVAAEAPTPPEEEAQPVAGVPEPAAPIAEEPAPVAEPVPTADEAFLREEASRLKGTKYFEKGKRLSPESAKEAAANLRKNIGGQEGERAAQELLTGNRVEYAMRLQRVLDRVAAQKNDPVFGPVIVSIEPVAEPAPVAESVAQAPAQAAEPIPAPVASESVVETPSPAPPVETAVPSPVTGQAITPAEPSPVGQGTTSTGTGKKRAGRKPAVAVEAKKEAVAAPVEMTFQQFLDAPREGKFLEQLRGLPRRTRSQSEIDAEQASDKALSSLMENNLSYLVDNPSQARNLKGKQKKLWDSYNQAWEERTKVIRQFREENQRWLYDKAVEAGIIVAPKAKAEAVAAPLSAEDALTRGLPVKLPVGTLRVRATYENGDMATVGARDVDTLAIGQKIVKAEALQAKDRPVPGEITVKQAKGEAKQSIRGLSEDELRRRENEHTVTGSYSRDISEWDAAYDRTRSRWQGRLDAFVRNDKSLDARIQDSLGKTEGFRKAWGRAGNAGYELIPVDNIRGDERNNASVVLGENVILIRDTPSFESSFKHEMLHVLDANGDTSARGLIALIDRTSTAYHAVKAKWWQSPQHLLSLNEAADRLGISPSDVLCGELAARYVSGDNTIESVLSNKTKARQLRNAINGEPEAKQSVRGVTPEQDAEYMAAVGRGDTEAAQRMVDRAAKKAGDWSGGISPVVYHGSPHSTFYEFAIPSKGFNSTVFGSYEVSRNAAFFTPNKEAASGYMTQGGRTTGSTRQFLILGEMLDWRKGVTDAQFNTLVGEGVNPRWLGQKGVSWELFDKEQDPDGVLVAAIKKMGYDGVIIKDTDGSKDFDSYVAFSPSQIKSADAITRDSSGAVIPLSQRFDTEKKDIRYSVKGEREPPKALVGTPPFSDIPKAYAEARTPVERAEQVDAIAKELDTPDKQYAEVEQLARGQKINTTDVGQIRAKYAMLNSLLNDVRTGQLREHMLTHSVAMYNWYAKMGQPIGSALQARKTDVLPLHLERLENLIMQMLGPDATQASAMAGKDYAQQLEIAGKRMKEYNAVLQKLKSAGLDLEKMTDKELEAAILDDKKYAAWIRDASEARSSPLDRAFEYWRNSILSGPGTQIVNAGGNIFLAAWELGIQRPLEAIANIYIKNPNAPTMSSLAAMYAALLPSFRPAMKNLVKAWETEMPSTPGTKMETSNVAIPAKYGGRYIRSFQRAMLAVDEFAKTVVGQATVADYAFRKALQAGMKQDTEVFQTFVAREISDTGSESWDMAIKEARRLALQEELGDIGKGFLRFRNSPGAGWVFKFLFPFVTTPMNIVLTGLRKSPLGILHTAALGVSGKYKGGEGQAKAITHAVENVTSLAIMALLMGYLDEKDEKGLPLITGSSSGTKNLGRREFETRNLPPLSFRAPGSDTWVSYSRMEPLATVLATTIDAINAFRIKGEEVPNHIIASLKTNVENKTFIQNIGDIMRTLEGESPPDKLVTGFLSSWIPNLARAPMRSSDEFVRDYRAAGKDLGTRMAEKTLQQAFPVEALAPIPRRTVWGAPVRRDIEEGGSMLYQTLVPFRRQSIEGLSRVEQMLYKAQKTVPEPWFPAPLSDRTFSRNGKKYTMDDAAFDKYQELAGQYAGQLLKNVNLRYDNPQQRDVDIVKNRFEQARKRALNEIWREMMKEEFKKQMPVSATPYRGLLGVQ